MSIIRGLTGVTYTVCTLSGNTSTKNIPVVNDINYGDYIYTRYRSGSKFHTVGSKFFTRIVMSVTPR